MDVEAPVTQVEVERTASQKDDSFTSLGGLNIPLKILLLKSRPKPLPKWMRFYRPTSYVAYFLIASYSWFYLVYIGIQQAHDRMEIQYSAIVRYLEFNSYSILSPLLCSLFMGLLVCHVKNRVKLADGDFFGVVGVLLFFALMNVHDGYGVYRLYEDNSNLDKKPPRQDLASRDQLHWQYAWSTRPSCARKYVQNLVYQFEFDRRHLKKQILVEFNSHMGHGNSRSGMDPASGKPRVCHGYHDDKDFAKTRKWMRDLQREFECCGPYGYKDWEQWFKNSSATKCYSKTGKQWTAPCFKFLMQWLNEIYFNTFLVMICQALLYIVSIIFFCIHFAAMKYEHASVEKQYSLLDMNIEPKVSILDHHRDKSPQPQGSSQPQPETSEKRKNSGASEKGKGALVAPEPTESSRQLNLKRKNSTFSKGSNKPRKSIKAGGINTDSLQPKPSVHGDDDKKSSKSGKSGRGRKEEKGGKWFFGIL